MRRWAAVRCRAAPTTEQPTRPRGRAPRRRRRRVAERAGTEHHRAGRADRLPAVGERDRRAHQGRRPHDAAHPGDHDNLEHERGRERTDARRPRVEHDRRRRGCTRREHRGPPDVALHHPRGRRSPSPPRPRHPRAAASPPTTTAATTNVADHRRHRARARRRGARARRATAITTSPTSSGIREACRTTRATPIDDRADHDHRKRAADTVHGMSSRTRAACVNQNQRGRERHGQEHERAGPPTDVEAT